MVVEQREVPAGGDVGVDPVGGLGVDAVVGDQDRRRAFQGLAHPGVDGAVVDQLDRPLPRPRAGEEYAAADAVEVGVGEEEGFGRHEATLHVPA